jgi:enoyl-CoA hydratase/carnithine racemase
LSDPADEVLYEVVDGAARITINRPERRNAINPNVVRSILRNLELAEADGARAIVLTGAGDEAFCAGADLGGMTGEGAAEQHFERAEIGELIKAMHASSLPIVARVNGHALAGGFGLMLSCDLVVAAEDVEMGMPEVNLGLWPFMISAIVRRDLPRKVALELMFTGRRIGPQEGTRFGFVNRVAARPELDAATNDLVDELKSKSPLILSLGKRSWHRAQDMDLEEALEYLAGMLTLCLQSEDTAEGVGAFFEKRKPQWKGR